MVIKWSQDRHGEITTLFPPLSRMQAMKTTTHIVYAAGSHAALLIAAVYAAGFAGNFLGPRSVDAAPQIPPPQALIFNLCLLALFAIQQRWTASGGFGRAWRVGGPVQRHCCVLFSSLALMLLLLLWQPVNTLVWDFSGSSIGSFAPSVFVAGWVLLAANYRRKPNLFCRTGLFLALGVAATMTLGHLQLALGLCAIAFWVYWREGHKGLVFFKAEKTGTQHQRSPGKVNLERES
jgi:hypothetical protein